MADTPLTRRSRQFKLQGGKRPARLWRSARAFFKTRHAEIRMAMVFLGLIIIPSGLLGYLSWRAIESEKMLSQERVQESYRQFAGLAAREIDTELEQAETRWISALNKIIDKDPTGPVPEAIEELARNEPLISACFLLTAPGQVDYPTGLSLRGEGFGTEPWENGSYVREYEIFNELVGHGEDLEYNVYDLGKAIATYRQILVKTSNPQLHAMAKSYIGRALMKKGDWTTALATFKDLLANYPEVRDVNKMYLRFLAQYQIAVCLESLDRDQESIETLLLLNRDLLERSDAIHSVQYSFFLDQIRNLTRRLLSSPNVSHPANYETQFSALAEQNKKRLSQKYFLQLLDRKLSKMVLQRKPYKPKFRYLSDETEHVPYLLSYRPLSDARGIYTTGLIGMQIDLAQLSQRLFPTILRNLKLSDQLTLAISNKVGDYVIGTERPAYEPIAVQILEEPFDFWQVAVYLDERDKVSRRLNFFTTLGIWLVCLLLLSILLGGYLFVRRARREAYLSQMKSTFVSNVSHELRTPLASINMLAELLEMQLSGKTELHAQNSEAGARQYISVIRRECGRLGRLIENILDFSKVERGVRQYKFEYEDPGAVLRMAVAAFQPHAEANGFKLQLDIEEPLPELQIDADAISQAVLNLMSNAVKYSNEAKEIRLRAFLLDSSVAIQVTDRGIGIAPDEIPKIFQEFYRADQRVSSRKQGGMGLGLTLVENIVLAHGGEIKVDSEVGKGSTFTMLLPNRLPVDGNEKKDDKQEKQYGLAATGIK